MDCRRRTWVNSSLSIIRLQVASYAEEFRSMVFSVRASAVLAGAILVLGGSLAPCQAAKTAVAGRSRVYVPAGMVKGSALASGRTFFKTRLPEDTLAGIRLGRRAQDILAKWGNPSRITVSSAEATPAGGVPPTQSGPQYLPPPTGLPGLPGLGIPGLPGMGGMYGMPGTPAQPTEQGASTSAVLAAEEVTWTYDLADGITLEFIITDGTITQITVGGVGPWGLSKTRTGLQLGDTYKLVLWVCGYPEYQKYAGRFLRVSYINKNRALFTFLSNKLVGVTIAMVESDLLK
jgi:hypothetical protein